MPFAFHCPHCQVGYQVKDELADKQTKCKKCGGLMLLKPSEVEKTSGGSVLLRHARRDRELEPATGDVDTIEAVGNHIQEYLGISDFVFHEIVSDLVHLDVYWIAPTPQQNWHTFVTSGMSERPMHVPAESNAGDYAEMVLCLPPSWKVSNEAFQLNNEEWYWPIRWLKTLARLPHEYETWLEPGHTIPNGDQPAPFHARTKTCCWLVIEPPWFDPGFKHLELPDGRSINFLSMLPIHAEEMKLKLAKGTDALADKLANQSLETLFDPFRKNTMAKRFGLF